MKTQPMQCARLWKLEMLRGLSAVAVLVCHFAVIFPALGASEVRNAVANWGVTAVVIFFVLSGAVIRLSVERAGFSTASFLWRRGVRILPLYFLAVAVSVALDPHSADATHIGGHLLFVATLPGWISPTFSSNPVLWSLSYEMFFYVLYALLGGPRPRGEKIGGALAAVCGALLCMKPSMPGWLAHWASMFAFYGVWMAGYLFVKHRGFFVIGVLPASLMAGCIPMLARSSILGGYPDYGQSLLVGLATSFLLAAWVGESSEMPRIRRGWFVSFAFYAVCTVVFLLLTQSRLHASIIYMAFPWFVLAGAWSLQQCRGVERLAPLAVWLGMISYALYLFHYPVFYAAAKISGDNSWLVAAAALVAIFLLSHFLEYSWQPRVAKWLSRCAPQRSQVGSQPAKNASA